jgi:hypothetical protein
LIVVPSNHGPPGSRCGRIDTISLNLKYFGDMSTSPQGYQRQIHTPGELGSVISELVRTAERPSSKLRRRWPSIGASWPTWKGDAQAATSLTF